MEGNWKATWLQGIERQKFFIGCTIHEKRRKNEKNIFCLNCTTSICPHCVPLHQGHRLVQVRRYVYHEVLRLEDLHKLNIDCSNVQSYTINSSKVVFIKKRPQNKQFKGSGNICTSCDRTLQDPYLHCSLGCKVDYVLRHKKDLSPYLRNRNSLQLSPDFLIPQEAISTDDEINETTHSTVVEDDDFMISSDSENYNNAKITDIITQKKRNGLCFCKRSTNKISVEDQATNISRRKGIPQRSPLC